MFKLGNKNRIVIPILLLGFLLVNSVVLPHYSFAAKSVPAVKTLGKAKFVLQGNVVATFANSITVHVTNTSKNAKVFDSKDQALGVSSKTSITKKGKTIPLTQIKRGDTIKVFGIFDKKTGTVTLVRWVKVIPK